MFTAAYGPWLEQNIGKCLPDVAPELWPKLEPLFRSVLDEGRVLTTELQGGVTSDSTSLRYWLSNLFPVQLGGGAPGLGVIALDVTDRKLLAEHQVHLNEQITGALVAVTEMRDPYTAGHQERVAAIAKQMAMDLGLDQSLIDEIELAAKVHDLGKIRVPVEILNRPGRLLPVELEVVRAHARSGYEILNSSGFPEHLSQMVLQHHERLDGSGYPFGLRDDAICTGARVIAVADVFEAMTAMRPYRAGLGQAAAQQELLKGRGITYDADSVDVLVHSLAREESGLINA